MAGKHNYDYFDVFEKMVGYSCETAEMLLETLTNFQVAELETKMQQMHQIEHRADMEKHEMMKKLAHEFITPIEREDIMMMAQEVDEITDSIEDVLMRVYMFHIEEIRPEALEFAEVIHKCCVALQKAAQDFHNFRKSETMHDSIVEVNSLEEVGDALYTSSMRTLYAGGLSPVEVMAWTETFDHLEKCCDNCEHVANVMESIIMKNS